MSLTNEIDLVQTLTPVVLSSIKTIIELIRDGQHEDEVQGFNKAVWQISTHIKEENPDWQPEQVQRYIYDAARHCAASFYNLDPNEVEIILRKFI